jgi:hypothetical protein
VISTESERYLQISDFRLRTSHFEVQTSDFGIVISENWSDLSLKVKMDMHDTISDSVNIFRVGTDYNIMTQALYSLKMKH